MSKTQANALKIFETRIRKLSVTSVYVEVVVDLPVSNFGGL